MLMFVVNLDIRILHCHPHHNRDTDFVLIKTYFCVVQNQTKNFYLTLSFKFESGIHHILLEYLKNLVVIGLNAIYCGTVMIINYSYVC